MNSNRPRDEAIHNLLLRNPHYGNHTLREIISVAKLDESQIVGQEAGGPIKGPMQIDDLVEILAKMQLREALEFIEEAYDGAYDGGDPKYSIKLKLWAIAVYRHRFAFSPEQNEMIERKRLELEEKLER